LGDDEARIARTEAVFRDVNERIAETAARFDSEHAEFVCECADAGCTERVAVSLPDYESVRSEPTYFVLAAGHSLGPPLERVVVDRPGYQIVEKIERALREHVKRLDPRAEPA
jgi:hypothetical protein